MEEEKGDYLMEKKIEYLIDMKVGKIQNQLKEVLDQMQKMSEELDVLKNKVQRLNLGVEPQTKLSEQSGEKEVKKEANSRTGDFTSKDVSIEKMFYFGNK